MFVLFNLILWQLLEAFLENYLLSAILINFNFFLFQDFGDYTEGYYTVQTQEGDQIANLISGYVDIILKRVTFIFLFILILF